VSEAVFFSKSKNSNTTQSQHTTLQSVKCNILCCDWWVSTSVSVVDNGVKRLVKPLPEDNRRSCPVTTIN